METGLKKKAGNGDIITINFDQPPKNGTTVYRTLDDSLMKELQASYNSPAPIKKIPVSIKFKAHVGENLELSLSDNENNTSTIVSDYIVEKSQKRPTTEDDVKKQLVKTGNTVFEALQIEVDMPDDAFIPIKELNNTRTEATAELEKIRIEKFRRPAHDRSSEILGEETENEACAGSEEKKILLSVSVNNAENLNSALKSGADFVYVDASLKELQNLEWKVMTEQLHEKQIPLYSYPRLF
ncbi:MAG: DUF3656 domain-containing protein [Methanolobus sp.]